MPRPKRPDFSTPADLLSRLPVPTIVTRGDKLALLRTLSERAGSIAATGVNRAILAGIERDIRAPGRAQKGSAPVRPGAPSRPEQRSEAGSSIPPKALERKIRIRDDVFHVFHNIGAIDIRKNDEHFLLLTPDEADQLAHALAELADDLRQDANARAWSQELVAATTG